MQVATLRAKYATLVRMLTERSGRVWAATDGGPFGYGGIALVARADLSPRAFCTFRTR